MCLQKSHTPKPHHSSCCPLNLAYFIHKPSKDQFPFPWPNSSKACCHTFKMTIMICSYHHLALNDLKSTSHPLKPSFSIHFCHHQVKISTKCQGTSKQIKTAPKCPIWHVHNATLPPMLTDFEPSTNSLISSNLRYLWPIPFLHTQTYPTPSQTTLNGQSNHLLTLPKVMPKFNKILLKTHNFPNVHNLASKPQNINHT